MMYKYLIRYSITLILVASVLSYGTFRGTVLDTKTSEPLIGANVMVGEIDLGIGANTDVDGEFLITDIPAGLYTVTVRYMGYDEFTKEIDVRQRLVSDKIRISKSE